MSLVEKNKMLKEKLATLDTKENELKAKIAEFKQLIAEKERKEKRVQDLLQEEAALLAKLGM